MEENNQNRMNDQDRLIEKIDGLQKDWSETDGELEELVKDVKKSEEEIVEDSDDETELSKSLRSREEEQDRIVGTAMESRDKALFDEDNLRKDKSIALDQLEKSINQDIGTVSLLESELSDEDPNLDRATELREKLEKKLEEVVDVRREWHSCDLAPINTGQNTTEPSQKGSLLDDFADSSTEPADYFGGDD